jgi:hypothetical protein
MPRPALGALALLAAVAAGSVMASPAVAQAQTTASSSHVASSVKPSGEIFWFSGKTYERAHGVSTYSCWLGNPDAGLYGLWLGDVT